MIVAGLNALLTVGATPAGVLTVNEVRAMRGLGPLEEQAAAEARSIPTVDQAN